MLAAIATWFVKPAPELVAPLVRGSVTPVAPAALSLDTFLSDLDISPDGTMIAFNGQRQGEAPQIFIRRLDQEHAVALPGTTEGRAPTFSDDGQWVSFRLANEVLKVPVNGGGPQTTVAGARVDSAAARGCRMGRSCLRRPVDSPVFGSCGPALRRRRR